MQLDFGDSYMTDLHPRAKYHKGQKVMVTQDYRSQVKMSHSVYVPKGTIVEVVETLFQDVYVDETLVRCRNMAVSSTFDFCIPERLVVNCTSMDRWLYG
jgi:hypothetical protein